MTDGVDGGRPRPCRLLTVGHGTLAAEELAGLLTEAGVVSLVDVRTAPGSRRMPHFGRTELEHWLPAAGVAYRWEGALGGFRKAAPDSPNVALRNLSFRGYADYMRGEAFSGALTGVLEEARAETVTVMCAETVWWRCHRRLIADAAVLRFEVEVLHLDHGGRLSPHRPTEGVRVGDDGLLVYDVGEAALPLGP